MSVSLSWNCNLRQHQHLILNRQGVRVHCSKIFIKIILYNCMQWCYNNTMVNKHCTMYIHFKWGNVWYLVCFINLLLWLSSTIIVQCSVLYIGSKIDNLCQIPCHKLKTPWWFDASQHSFWTMKPFKFNRLYYKTRDP